MPPEKLHVSLWGQAGPKIVLVHGSAQGSKVGGDKHFARQQRLATEAFQLIVPDRPGHGRSASPGRPDDADADGVWVADLLGDGAHLVGHSFGGAVALAAAARRPEAIRSLTLIEPAMQTLALDDGRVRRFVLRIVTTMIFSLSPERRAKRFAQILKIPSEIRGGEDHAELAAMGRAIRRLKVPKAASLRSQLATIRTSEIPLLVVTGGWNPAFTAIGERVAKEGRGEHRIIPSTHHFPNLVSEEFNDMLADHVRTAERSAGHEEISGK